MLSMARGTFQRMDGQPRRPWLRSRKVVWLTVAGMVSCGVVFVLVVLFDNAASLGLTSPTRCTLGYGTNPVRVTFDGAGAAAMCDDWHASDGSWRRVSTTVAGDATVCTGTHGGLSWRVVDDASKVYGVQACNSLNELAQGGTLNIP